MKTFHRIGALAGLVWSGLVVLPTPNMTNDKFRMFETEETGQLNMSAATFLNIIRSFELVNVMDSIESGSLSVCVCV